MANNFQRFNTDYVLRDYFKDIKTYNFKYGLEYGLSSNLGLNSTGHGLMNLDEDPTVLGFDVVILNESPLFNQIDSFLDFGEQRNIKDIQYRSEIYQDFISQFSKFFNVDDRNRGDFKIDGRFNSFKSHYLEKVTGLDKVINSIGVGGKGISKGDKNQFAEFGTDKLTFTLTEDVGLNAGYLSALYRNLMYSKRSGRQVIPENLMRFDMVVILSEIRNFNRVANSYSKIVKETKNFNFEDPKLILGSESPSDVTTRSVETINKGIKIFNDNINRYIFTLYDCQLDFNNYSFDNDIDQAGLGVSLPGFSKGLSFDVFYKYVGFEMEKFNFHPSAKDGNLLDIPKFVNDIKINPTSFQINPDTESGIDTSQDKFPNRTYDLRYQMNTTQNSEGAKAYEFDFPMLSAKYARNDIDLRNRNLETASNQGAFRQGLNTIIDRANQGLQQRFIEARSQLISDLASKVREATGFRNISSPTNVYQGTGVGQFILNQVRDFANLGISTAIGTGAGFLNNLSKGAENSIFDAANNGANKLKGFENRDNSNPFTGNNGRNNIPNVYRK
jgi:hypothetical protein